MAVIEVSMQEIQALVKQGMEGNHDALNRAELLINQILNKQPDNWFALFYYSNIFINKGLSGLAINVLKQCYELQPNLAEITNNIGTCYRREHMHKEAEEWFLKSLEINPNDADIYNNLSTLHINEGSPEKAVEYLTKALELQPHNRHAHWNLGLAQLELEQWEQGFKNYVWGLATRDRLTKNYGNAVWWDGKPHPGKKLVIFGEQGIGDEILAFSMIKEAVERFEGEVIFDCHPRLEGMFRRAMPELKIYPTRKIIAEPVSWIEKEAPIHYKCPIFNLGQFFRKTEADFPKKAYLTPDREKVEEYKEWLQLIGPGPYIGVSWVGGHKKTRKDLRAIPLKQWKPVFDKNPGTYISLQYTDHGRDDTKQFLKDTGIKVHHFEELTESAYWERWDLMKGDERLGRYHEKDHAKSAKKQLHDKNVEIVHHIGPGYDYDETFALVSAIVELGGTICSVNTSLVHLMGAAGYKAFVATPAKPAWRYGLTRDDMVMYPSNSVSQYRQQENTKEAWEPVIETIANDINDYLGEQKCAPKKTA